jgi:hypothetical protein
MPTYNIRGTVAGPALTLAPRRIRLTDYSGGTAADLHGLSFCSRPWGPGITRGTLNVKEPNSNQPHNLSAPAGAVSRKTPENCSMTATRPAGSGFQEALELISSPSGQDPYARASAYTLRICGAAGLGATPDTGREGQTPAPCRGRPPSHEGRDNRKASHPGAQRG